MGLCNGSNASFPIDTQRIQTRGYRGGLYQLYQANGCKAEVLVVSRFENVSSVTSEILKESGRFPLRFIILFEALGDYV